MTALTALWAIPTARYVLAGLVGALACAVAFGGWLWVHDSRVADRAEQAVIERSEKAGEKAEAKADAAHEAAAKPGAAARVLAKYCRDCGQP